MPLYLCFSESGSLMGIFNYRLSVVNARVRELPDPEQSYQGEKHMLLGYSEDAMNYSTKEIPHQHDFYWIISDVRETLVLSCGVKLVEVNRMFGMQEGLLCVEEEWNHTFSLPKTVPKSLVQSRSFSQQNPTQVSQCIKSCKQFQAIVDTIGFALGDCIRIIKQYLVEHITGMSSQMQDGLIRCSIRSHQRVSKCLIL